MDYRFSPEEERFRTDLRDFLHKECPPEKSGAISAMKGGDEIGEGTVEQELRRKLAQRGWLTMGWPKDYGGQGASPLRQTVFLEEMAFHDAPGLDLMGINIVGPTIMKYGREDQKRKYLGAISRGEVTWAQGFSEPGAGSDLGGMSTRADLNGDAFLVNGQKIWSSGAHRADYLFLLARSNQEVPKHKGISAFIVDLKNTKKGLEIRPIINMAGMKGFNECFFTNMEVPRENLVGELNQGWYYAMSLLESERSSFIQFSAIGRSVIEGLVKMVNDPKSFPLPLRERTPGGSQSSNPPSPVPGEDPWRSQGGEGSVTPRVKTTIRAKLADAAIENRVARDVALNVAWMASNGLKPDYQASVAKVFNTEAFKRLAVSAMSIVGLYGQFEHEPRYAPLMGRVNGIYYTSVGMTIAGGASEIQRNVIATRGLGLPR
ncbi:MAG: acyl-CoA dehydrogenase family protein [Chloroflexi bacterium]|nr:acyl-CoA dehydrogenase family protein [Chloroflexota bacterium]